MSARPNFTEARLVGGRVNVHGQSDPDPEGDIVGIRVVLSQGGQMTTGDVQSFGAGWDVEMSDDGFKPGPATAFGVETRREHATTTSWAQSLDITG